MSELSEEDAKQIRRMMHEHLIKYDGCEFFGNIEDGSYASDNSITSQELIEKINKACQEMGFSQKKLKMSNIYDLPMLSIERDTRPIFSTSISVVRNPYFNIKVEA